MFLIMRVITLGTAGMAPTRNRSLPSILLDYYGDVLLFDVGENTQRQLLKAGINRNRVSYIFITHWHADHTSGLPGLLHTMNANQANKELWIIGPKGTKKHVKAMLEAFEFKPDLLKLRILESSPKRVKTIFKTPLWRVIAAPMDHSIPINAYAFIENDKWKIEESLLDKSRLSRGPWLKQIQQGRSVRIKGRIITPEMVARHVKGRKVVVIMDTRPNNLAISLAKNADIAFIESMFSHKHLDRAIEAKHLTALEAAMIAMKAGIKKLVLIHISQRYKNPGVLLREARRVFPNTILPRDLDVFSVPKP